MRSAMCIFKTEQQSESGLSPVHTDQPSSCFLLRFSLPPCSLSCRPSSFEKFWTTQFLRAIVASSCGSQPPQSSRHSLMPHSRSCSDGVRLEPAKDSSPTSALRSMQKFSVSRSASSLAHQRVQLPRDSATMLSAHRVR